MEDGDNPYEILGVAPDATATQIRKAWLKMSKKFHPDKAKTEEEVKEHTVKMFKINAAYELLSDETKRRQYDQQGTTTEDYDDEEEEPDPASGGAYYEPENEDYQEPPPSGGAYYEPEEDGFEEPPRARPGRMGRPYQGSVQSTPFSYDCDGQDGRDATDGFGGAGGVFPGGHGGNGQDAGTAGKGSPGSNVKIFIKTTLSASGYFNVDVHASRGYGEVMDPTRRNLTQVPLKAFASVEFTAQGGAGGDGGIGGPGGHGAKGYRGRDATRYSNGTNGGPGGDGGDGGRGSNGADGGRGGNVQIHIDLDDIYLLMRVDACDPRKGVGNRVSGGIGGARGQHGKAGRGGSGGAGGSSYSWTETRSTYVNGEYRTYSVPHTNPGGWMGRSGKKGYTHKYPLIPGNDGADGTFEIHVKTRDGTDILSRRYDLKFQETITKHLSDMPSKRMFEFGETVLVDACRIRNTGHMVTPRQRTMIAFVDARGVNPTWSDRLFLARDSQISPGGEIEARQGHLRYICPFPTSLGPDYDPIRKRGTTQYVAHQLGPENNTTDPSSISDFQEKYTHFHDSVEDVEMAFPIENRAGILGIHSLGTRETTILRLKLHNISNQSFGADSKTGRALFIQFYYADDKEYEIPLKNIVVRGDGGQILNIDPSKGRGHRKNILTLARRNDTTIQLTFKLDAEELRPCTTAGLQADIYLQKIPTLHPDGTTSTDGKKRLVQRRLFVASHQPKFAEEEESDVVLVTTTASTAEQVSAWESLVSDRLGLRSKVYSLSRYGHIDATQVGEEKKLEETLGDNLVVVLNEQYYTQPNVESERKTKGRPSQLMNSVFDFGETTRFLVVGGQANTVQHMSPKAAGMNTVESQKTDETVIQQKHNCKSFRNDLMETVEKERVKGFAKERVAPSCQVAQVKTRTIFRTPEKSRYEGMVSRRSQRLQKWLAKKDKLRHYRVEWQAHERPTPVGGEDAEKGWRRKCWNVGEFRIYIGSPRYQNTMVLLGEETNTSKSILSEPQAIRNISTIHSTISAAPFETKMKCYSRCVRAVAESRSKDDEEVCAAVRCCLVSDFLWDVCNYHQGRMKVESAMDRSPTLGSLLSSETFWELVDESLTSDVAALKDVMTKEVSMLLAGLLSAAESKDLCPWWSPLSPKHRARKDMRESIEPLQLRLSSLVDQEKVDSEREQIERDAKHHIKDIRGKFLLRARGRWREALAVVHSPSNPQRSSKSLSTVRTRREAELDIGTSYKAKKLSAESAAPKDAVVARRDMKKRLETSHRIRETTQTEREIFIQT